MNSFFRLIRLAYQQEKNFFIKILIISMIQPLPGFISKISFKENKSLNIDKQLLNKYTDFSTSFINKDTEILTKKLWYSLILKIFEVAAALFIIMKKVFPLNFAAFLFFG